MTFLPEASGKRTKFFVNVYNDIIIRSKKETSQIGFTLRMMIEDYAPENTKKGQSRMSKKFPQKVRNPFLIQTVPMVSHLPYGKDS